MTKKESKKLRELLPRGYAKKTAKKTKYSRQMVYLVASGKRNNEKILKELFLLAIANKKQQTDIKQKLKDL